MHLHDDEPTGDFFHRPWLAAMVGGIGAIAFGFLSYVNWQDCRAFASPYGPTAVTLGELGQRPVATRLWTKLTDATLHCDNAMSASMYGVPDPTDGSEKSLPPAARSA